MARYRWALRPGWILSHLFVLACVVTFVCLGVWQLNRLSGRREANDLIRARQAEPVVPVDDLLSAGSGPDEVEPTVHRQVTITGTYVTDDQVLVRNRTNNGSPGYWVVTPLRTAPGEAVVVNRGWIPIQTGDQVESSFYAPPEGTVTVTGLVVDTQEQSGLGVVDPSGERLATLSRVDVGRLQEQVGDDLYPVFVNLVTQDPAQSGLLPEPVPPPELDDGPHLNYAGQWFIFATLTVVVYPLLLRRTARTKAAEAAAAAAEPARGVVPDDELPADARTGGGADPTGAPPAAPSAPSEPVASRHR